MAGEANGTSIFVAIEDTPGSDTWTQIGGQLSHTLTLNNTPIDITSKDDSSFRTLMNAEGLQSCDLALELKYNSNAAYLQLRALFSSKVITNFRITIGGNDFDCAYQVASFSEASPDNDKVTNSVSLQSSGQFTWV